MRRSLLVSAGLLALLGLEVASGAVSLASERLLAGTAAFFRGEAAVLPLHRVIGGWLLLVAAASLTVTVGWAERAARRVGADGMACPRCGSPTRRIRRRLRHRLLEHLLEQDLARRSCARCGWTGLTGRG